MALMYLTTCFLQKTVTFSPDDALQQFLSIPRLWKSGTYTIFVSINDEYNDGEFVVDVIRGDGAEFQALPQYRATPPPTDIACLFTLSGAYIVVKFNKATDLGGVDDLTRPFLCNLLMQFHSSEFTYCKWSDNSKLLILLDSSHNITKGDNITIKENKVKAACRYGDCSSWASMSKASAIVDFPESPLGPQLSVVVPSLLSACSNLTIDLSFSTGSLGRDWSVVKFSMLESSEASISAKRLCDILNAIPVVKFRNQITIHRSLVKLDENVQYSYSVRVCNFMEKCAERVFSFFVSSSVVPSARIQGADRRVVKRNLPLTLYGSTEYVSCGSSNGDSSNVSLWWKVFDDTGATIDVISSSRVASRFAVDAFTFDVGMFYSVELTAFNSFHQTASSARVSLQVIKSSIVAKISGGKYQSIAAGATLVLDGSGSLDEDLEEPNPELLSYDWTCRKIGSSNSYYYSKLCPLSYRGRSDRSHLELVADNLGYPSYVGSKIEIMLSVSSDDGRHDSCTVYIEIVSETAPLIVVSTDDINPLIDPLSRFNLQATVTTKKSCLMEWTAEQVDIGPVAIQQYADSSTTRNLIVSSVSNVGEFKFISNLALRPGSLLSGTKYMFTLSCTMPDSDVTTSESVMVVTNDVPSPGTFAVSPNQGVELETEFLLEASLWSDTEIPLTYSFEIYLPEDNLLTLQGRSEFPSLMSRLGRGRSDDSFALYLGLNVYDSFDAKSTKTITARVEPKSNPLDHISNNALGQKEIAITSNLLNAVDCSASPNCSMFNRKICATTPGTCGECKEGYIGEEGSSNTICIPSSQASSVASSRSSPGARIGQRSVLFCSECTAWEDCIPDSDNGLKLCLETQKKCPLGSCSGHGSCKYISNEYPFEYLSDCWIGSVACSAVCVCGSSYAGLGCEYEKAEYVQKKEIRESTLMALKKYMAEDDISASTAQSYVSTLLVLSRHPEEMTLWSIATATEIAGTIVDICNEVTLSREYLFQFLKSLDQMMHAALIQSQSTSVIRGYIDDTCRLIAKSVVLGESSIARKIGNTRVSYRTVDFSSTSSIDFVMALSDLESALGIAATTVTLSGIASDVDPVIGWLLNTNATLFNDKNNDALYNTDIASIEMALSGSGVSAVNLLNGVTLVMSLQNQIPIVYSTVPITPDVSYAISTSCTPHDQALNLTCPDSGLSFVTECNSTNGVSTAHCPSKSYNELPACVLIDDPLSPSFSLQNCRVVSFDSFKTTCSCLFEVNESRRLSSGTKNINRLSFSTVTQEVVIPTGSISSAFVPIELPVASHNGSLVHHVYKWICVFAIFCLLYAYAIQYKIDRDTEKCFEKKRNPRKSISRFSARVSKLRGMMQKMKSKCKKRLLRLSKVSLRSNKVLPMLSSRSNAASSSRDQSRKRRPRKQKRSLCSKICKPLQRKASKITIERPSFESFQSAYRKFMRILSNGLHMVLCSVKQYYKRCLRNVPLKTDYSNLHFPNNIVDCVGSISMSNDFVEKSIPQFYRASVSPMYSSMIWNEICMHHKWGVLVDLLLFPLDASRALKTPLFRRALCFFANILAAIFVLSATYYYYDLNEEDSASCGSYLSETNCSAPDIGIGVGNFFGDACQWDVATSECGFRSASTSTWSIMAASCLVAVIVVPLSGSINYLVSGVLFSETERHSSKSCNKGMLQFLPIAFIERLLINQSEASIADGYYDLKDRGLSLELQSVLKQSKLDLVLLTEEAHKYAKHMESGGGKTSFMNAWGLEDEDSEPTENEEHFVDAADCSEQLSVRSNDSSYYQAPSSLHTQDHILRKLIQVNLRVFREQKRILHQLQYSKEPLSEVRVIKLLFEDLLSDDELFIFRKKCQRNIAASSESVEPKTVTAKIVAVCIVLWLLWIFVIGVFYFGYDRDDSSQKLWLLSLIYWILLDMFFFQPVLILISEVLIPNLISGKVSKVQAMLVRCICQLDSSTTTSKKFNWSLMMFASARVVSKYYSSRISELINMISLSVPLRSVKNFTYSNRAIEKLNVYNSENDVIVLANNDKHWDPSRLFIRFVSAFCFSDVSVELLCAFSSSFLVLILVVVYSELSLGLFLTVILCFICFNWLASAYSFYYCRSKRPRMKMTRRDRDERIMQVLGGQAYTPRPRRSTSRRNAALLAQEDLKRLQVKETDSSSESLGDNMGELSLVASMNQSVEFVESCELERREPMIDSMNTQAQRYCDDAEAIAIQKANFTTESHQREDSSEMEDIRGSVEEKLAPSSSTHDPFDPPTNSVYESNDRGEEVIKDSVPPFTATDDDRKSHLRNEINLKNAEIDRLRRLLATKPKNVADESIAEKSHVEETASIPLPSLPVNENVCLGGKVTESFDE